MDAVWNDERTARLKELWASGWSASRIAPELRGGFTRSAILGKIMRLKLPPRDKGHVRGPTRTTTRRFAPPPVTSEGRIRNVTRLQAKANGHDPGPMQRRNPSHNILASIAIAEDEPGLPERFKGEAPDGTGIQLRDLTDATCHFPRGDPQETNFEFCGGSALKGLPYCAHHCRISYLPSSRAARGV